MTKIVYNACYGGFGLSPKAIRRYYELGGKTESVYDIERTDPILVQIVEELGEKANSLYANLRIIDLEPGTRYRITDYDGFESIETKHDTKWNIA